MSQYVAEFYSKLQEAFEFANEAHADQMRGDGVTPYVFHCIDVAKRIEQSWPTHHHAIIAGMLHDVVEDTAVTIMDVEAKFGWRVAGIVAEVTDPPGLRGEERYQRQLESFPSMSSQALMVKWADKMSNLHDIIHHPPKWDPIKIERNKNRLNLHVEALVTEICARGLDEVAA